MTEKSIREIEYKVMDLLKLHERQIINVGSHDEEEARRRRGVRLKTTKHILSLFRERLKEAVLSDEEIVEVEQPIMFEHGYGGVRDACKAISQATVAKMLKKVE